MDRFRRFSLTVAILAVALFGVHGHRMFQDKIPNGKNVPHPCIPGQLWNGVGHESSGGGGVRNPFGIAFYQNGKVWNRTLCEADSDGDGMTNGQELGDPNCQWTEGSNMAVSTTGLSHPGVCTPFNSDKCRGQSTFVTCESFVCPAIDEPETTKFTIKIPKTPVPAQETTYQCMPFEFPLDAEYHMVAFKPNIDNWNVMHHAIIYGCNDQASIDNSELNQTYNCFMGDREGCNDFLAIWALGIDGYCYIDVAGLPVGQKGYKRAILELHWNNPEKVSTYTDGSGLDIFLTKKLRQYDAAVLMIGEQRLHIPPQEDSYTVKGKCHSDCTQQAMSGSVNVFSVFNHMHDLGKSARSQLIVPGKRVEYLGNDIVYDYNSPVNHVLDPPMVVHPGDEFELICEFNSMKRNVTTAWGLQTADEMCYAFLTYYPAQNVQAAQCVSTGIFKECEPARSQPTANGCDFKKIFNTTLPENVDRFTKVDQLCSSFFCQKECMAYVKELYQTPCYNEVNRQYLKSFYFGSKQSEVYLRDYWSKVESCNMEIGREQGAARVVMEPNDQTSASERGFVNGFLVTCLLGIALIAQ